MKITHFGHACLLVETDTARILFDPGTLSSGFGDERDLDAILISHGHPDHLDLDQIASLRAANPGAAIYSDVESAPSLTELGGSIAAPGDTLTFGATTVQVLGGDHANIFEDFPGAANVSYLVDAGAYFHPGDSFVIPDVPIDVLGLNVDAPWLKVADAIDYLRAVHPRIAVPIHQGEMKDSSFPEFLVTHFSPEGTTVTKLEERVATAVSANDAGGVR